MKKRIAVFLILIAGLAGLAFTPPAERYFEIAKNLDIFASLYKEVNGLYVDEVNPNKLIRTGIDAMLNSLDPYTNYVPEDEVEDFRAQNTGQYGGIGAATREFRTHTVVSSIYDGYPAARGGLKIGDEILKIDEVDLSKISVDEANRLMRGQVGTSVTVTVKRQGVDQPTKYTFKREKIKISNVPYVSMITPDVGYFQLTEFTQEAGKEVKNAVETLKQQGAKSIILDLRDNPGGLLVEAVNICNVFIPKGKLVVSMRGKLEESNSTYETLNNPVDVDMPVAVLINRGSASASEIVSGTLQDYDRAVIIGEKSYGKGLVQVSRPLSYNSQVKITTAKYYTPTGRCIQVLDYTHRREDGSVASVPDSIKKSFKTTRGRTVYDGGGIDPDVITKGIDASAIAQTLYTNGFLFDYATLYASKHPTIASAKEFSLTNNEYDEFVDWMKGKKYDYHSEVEAQLAEVVDEAKKEGYYTELKPQLDQINTKLIDSRKNDLVTFKDQIKMLLEEDIVSRYYFEKGSVEAGFKYDNDIKKAIELVNNPSQYNKILNVQ